MTAGVLCIDIAKTFSRFTVPQRLSHSKKKVCEADASFPYSQKENEEHKRKLTSQSK